MGSRTSTAFGQDGPGCVDNIAPMTFPSKLAAAALVTAVLGCNSSSSGGAGGGGGSAPSKSGNVGLAQDGFSFGGSPVYTAFAYATFSTGFDAGTACTSSTFGECRVSDCSLPLPLPEPESAGRITLTGPSLTSVDGGVAALDFGDAGYVFFRSTARLWNGGDTLVVDAPGATVPAFHQTIVGPADLTLTAPSACDSANCGSLSRAHGVVPRVDWRCRRCERARAGAVAEAPPARSRFNAPSPRAPAPSRPRRWRSWGRPTPATTTTSTFTSPPLPSFTAGDYHLNLTAQGIGASGYFTTSD